MSTLNRCADWRGPSSGDVVENETRPITGTKTGISGEKDETVGSTGPIHASHNIILSSVESEQPAVPVLSEQTIFTDAVRSADDSSTFVNTAKRVHYDIMSSASESSCSSGRHSPSDFGSNIGASRRSSALSTDHSLRQRSILTAAARRTRTVSGSMTEDHFVRRGGKVVYTAGRPSWFDCHGSPLHEPFIIGICGGSASGKTTVAERIIAALDVQWVTLLSMDSFYKVLSEEQHQQAVLNLYDFDHPDAFDFELLRATLQRLREGKCVQVPIYNFGTHRREKRYRTMYGASVLIFEGIMAFHMRDILDMMDLKIFVDTDSDTRLARRLQRDVTSRGRDVEGVLDQYNRFVKPAFDSFIAPTMRHADIIIPRGGDNRVAIDLIVRHIKTRLTERECQNRAKLAMGACGGHPTPAPLPPSLHVLQQTPQVRGLHTFIRNKETPRDEFIFYSSRLMRLLLEFALSFMPFDDSSVTTPECSQYPGKGRKDKICGISILRAGETMEPALREVVKDCIIGKILIQTNTSTQEPELYYFRLPKDVHTYQIFLLDATVATGAAAMMAIRILLDHDVSQENITLVSLLMAETGVHSVAYAFPNVRIITTAVDKDLSKNYHILPGIGNFGDRYFGTEMEPRQKVKSKRGSTTEKADSVFDSSGEGDVEDDEEEEELEDANGADTESGVSSGSKQ